MAAKKEQVDPCPKCFLQENVIEPLVYAPGSRSSHYCSKGHEYDDREELSALMSQMSAKRSPKKSVIVKPETVKTEPIHDATVRDETPEGFELDPGVPSQQSSGDGIYINAIDFSRMSMVIGHFTDSSSLFGAIFALNQELADTRELLSRAEAAKQLSAVKKVNGDIIVQLVIPERHAGPLNDIAEANQMDLVRYVNSRFEQGCDDMYFY